MDILHKPYLDVTYFFMITIYKIVSDILHASFINFISNNMILFFEGGIPVEKYQDIHAENIYLYNQNKPHDV